MGRIEPVSGTLTVAAIPGEEIVQLSAHVGQTVKKDVVLAVLGSQKLRSEERSWPSSNWRRPSGSSRPSRRWRNCDRRGADFAPTS